MYNIVVFEYKGLCPYILNWHCHFIQIDSNALFYFLFQIGPCDSYQRKSNSVGKRQI